MPENCQKNKKMKKDKILILVKPTQTRHVKNKID